MMIGRKVKRTSSNSVLTETKNKILNWVPIKKKIEGDCTCIHTVAFSVLFYFEKTTFFLLLCKRFPH